MNYIERLFTTNKLNDVFTPTTTAKLTYVNRSTLESDLEKYLTLPGKQIVVYGHSGSGKTTLLRNKLKYLRKNYIKTHCESSTTFNDILLQAFDDLNRFYVTERTSDIEYSVSSELKSEFQLLSSKISSTLKESQGEKSARIVPPQLTPLKLAKFLGEINCVWIIEDFHKVVEHEKKRIADVIKIFIDAANDYPNMKIVCIGAVATARELIELDNNLNNRIAEQPVPLLTDKEIETFINRGFQLLNVSIEEPLKHKIVYYSNNLASIAHEICYDLCFHSGISKSRFFPKRLKNDVFKIAIQAHVSKNSDTFTKIYDTIVLQSYGWYLLRTFDALEKENLSFDEIYQKIPSYKKPEKEELFNYLEQLGSAEYKEIIRYNRTSHKYSIASPFFRAFLKMKLALEKSEQKASNDKKRNKMYNKYAIDEPIPKIFFDEKFFLEYNKVLETIVTREIELKGQFSAIQEKRKK